MTKIMLKRIIIFILGFGITFGGFYFIFSTGGATSTANIFDAVAAIIIGLLLMATAIFFKEKS
ncbi:MAG: hypothetical protein DRJ26_04275 [Candidatus Methanomethylicota archaeon]|uniref:Uncharacterized protein n=1 Tax=Thermoproteota archaeon TaxID=2056631 RepID=A0A497EZE5_9CREN|nr:MAG: hypothetical protein DRJ26_04275 [Candidatus Verstraetearchaeota archaeon]